MFLATTTTTTATIAAERTTTTKRKTSKSGKIVCTKLYYCHKQERKRKANLFYKLVSFLFPFLGVFSLLALFLVCFWCFVLFCFALFLVLPTGRLNVNFTWVLLGHRTRQMSFRRATKLKTNFARWAAVCRSLMCVRKISNVMRVKHYLGFGFSSSGYWLGLEPFGHGRPAAATCVCRPQGSQSGHKTKHGFHAQHCTSI